MNQGILVSYLSGDKDSGYIYDSSRVDKAKLQIVVD